MNRRQSITDIAQPSSKAGADRVLFVLATLARHGHPINARDLAQKTGLAQSTLYRQIALLKQWGFVAEIDGKYAPGPVGLQLAMGFDQASHLVHEAKLPMARLAAESGESVGLIVAVKDQAVCLEMVESQHSLRCSFEKGRGIPLLDGASAKSLLAFMPGSAARQIVTDLLGAKPGRQTQLFAELDRIRERGFVVTEGEVDPGVWGISAPLFRQPGKAAGTLTLMAPATRAHQKTQQLIDATLATARVISARLQDF